MKLHFLTAVMLAGLTLSGCNKAAAPTPSDIATLQFSTPESYGAYMIVMGKDYEAKDLGKYAASLPPIYAKYGGKYVAFSTDTSVMEGAYGYQSLIISGWPSTDAAKAFWTSPEYIEAKKLRDGIGTFDVVIVPALSAK